MIGELTFGGGDPVGLAVWVLSLEVTEARFSRLCGSEMNREEINQNKYEIWIRLLSQKIVLARAK